MVDYAGALGEPDSAMRQYSVLGEFDPKDIDVGHVVIDVSAQIARTRWRRRPFETGLGDSLQRATVLFWSDCLACTHGHGADRWSDPRRELRVIENAGRAQKTSRWTST